MRHIAEGGYPEQPTESLDDLVIGATSAPPNCDDRSRSPEDWLLLIRALRLALVGPEDVEKH